MTASFESGVKTPFEKCLDILDDATGDDAAVCACLLTDLRPRRAASGEIYVRRPPPGEGTVGLLDPRLGDWIAARFERVMKRPMPAEALSSAVWAVSTLAPWRSP